MDDDMGSGSICYCFSLNVHSAAQFSVKGNFVTLEDIMSLNQTRCHHPLITQLSCSHGGTSGGGMAVLPAENLPW